MRGEPDGGEQHDSSPSLQPDLDLVEYVVMTTSRLSSTIEVAQALKALVDSSRIAILDLVGVEVDTAGGYVAVEAEELPGMAELTRVEGKVGRLLSEDDIALTCGAMAPGTSALIMVAEDRWARPLADAVRRGGGRIVGGERIPRRRVEQSLRARSQRRHPEGT